MPQITRVLTAEDLAGRGKSGNGLDLTPYIDMVEQILTDGGVGGEVDLAPDERMRTEKGRLTRAAKARDRRLVWRKAPQGQLRFVLATPGAEVPGGRPRRKPAPVPVPEPAPPAPKGRKRKAS